MAVGGFDIELNGVKYNLAEDAEGDHYLISGQPLRPPNAVTVQGESQQKFQMRPDTLLWSITDWSGGEGQHKFDPQAPNRSRYTKAADVFSEPGKLKSGPYAETTGVTVCGLLVSALGTLYLYDHNDNDVYTWNDGTAAWDAGAAITGPTAGDGAINLCFDGTEIFFQTEPSAGSATLWRTTPGTTTATSVDTALPVAYSICAQGDYIYIGPECFNNPKGGNIEEVPKTGGAGTVIASTSLLTERAHMIPMEGKVYAVVTDTFSTEIIEIVPTSAAGTGYGRQLALLDGFGHWGAWQHSGTLYMIGQFGDSDDTAILYLQPDGTYGTLGKVRQHEAPAGVGPSGPGRSVNNAGYLIDHFFVTNKTTTDDDSPSLWQIDAVSGGFVNFSYPANSYELYPNIFSMAMHNGDVWWELGNSTLAAGRAFRTHPDEYAGVTEAVTPWHDFGLADEKVLSSIVLSMEDLPNASWDVLVDYAINGEDTWTNVITYETLNGNGEKVFVSDDLSTVKFHTLSIRIRTNYGAGNNSPTQVKILGVDALAMVTKQQKVWNLLLDMSDDRSGGQGHSGNLKQDNLITAGDSENVVAFKDGYRDKTPGVFDEYDVVVDSYALMLSTPGEGVAQVVLRETA